MITDEERRDIAERLRDMDESASVMDMILIIEPDVRKPYTWRDLAERIADLIEPHEPHCIANVTIDGEELERVANKAVKEAIGIDRDALLKLAYFMDRVAVKFMDTAPHEFNPCTLAKAWAREIREALGVDE